MQRKSEGESSESFQFKVQKKERKKVESSMQARATQAGGTYRAAVAAAPKILNTGSSLGVSGWTSN